MYVCERSVMPSSRSSTPTPFVRPWRSFPISMPSFAGLIKSCIDRCQCRFFHTSLQTPLDVSLHFFSRRFLALSSSHFPTPAAAASPCPSLHIRSLCASPTFLTYTRTSGVDTTTITDHRN